MFWNLNFTVLRQFFLPPRSKICYRYSVLTFGQRIVSAQCYPLKCSQWWIQDSQGVPTLEVRAPTNYLEFLLGTSTSPIRTCVLLNYTRNYVFIDKLLSPLIVNGRNASCKINEHIKDSLFVDTNQDEGKVKFLKKLIPLKFLNFFWYFRKTILNVFHAIN